MKFMLKTAECENIKGKRQDGNSYPQVDMVVKGEKLESFTINKAMLLFV